MTESTTGTTKTTKYNPAKHGPIRIDSTAKVDPKYLERDPFFQIDDDEYTVVRNPSPAMGLRFLEIVRQRGEIVATAQMFDDLVEPAGSLKRLSKVEGIDPGTVEALMAVVGDKLTSVAQDLTGN